jgi:hemoglobin
MEQERTVFKQLGGMEAFQRIAAAFYRRVETDDILRPLYPPELDAARTRLALFLAQFFGGPADYNALRGHPRLRMRHFPFSIGQAERDRWLSHMLAAVDEAGVVEPARSVMAQYFAATSTFLINQPAINQPAIEHPAINQSAINQRVQDEPTS